MEITIEISDVVVDIFNKRHTVVCRIFLCFCFKKKFDFVDIEWRIQNMRRFVLNMSSVSIELTLSHLRIKSRKVNGFTVSTRYI